MWVDVLLDVPITSRVAADQPTHAPMVQATIGGEATRLILDTGSSDHILTVELAGRIGLQAQPGEAGTDSTGASVPSWTLGDVPIQVHGHDFTLGGVVAITAPAPFEGWGIGGFISPQHLHASAWVVLDMAGERLVLLDGGAEDADVAAWLAERTANLRLLRLERAPPDPTVLVQAAIEPHAQVTALLDSGGKGTEVVTAAVPGLAGGTVRSIGRGVGGGESFGAEAQGQALRIGGATVPVPRLILRDEMEGRDILIGMTVLRGTILTVSADPERPVFWQVRAAAD